MHLEWSTTPVHDEEGEVSHWLSVQRDVTPEVEAEQRQRLLTDELNHRVRNLLGLASSPIGPDETAEAYQAALISRLEALVDAHELVFEAGPEDGAGEGARLDDLAAAVLAPFAAGDRISRSGPEVRLSNKQALNAVLLLRELCTNATKYGALSVPGAGRRCAGRRTPWGCGSSGPRRAAPRSRRPAGRASARS